jgi:selenocysteine lyase/cysteine desulfurase
VAVTGASNLIGTTTDLAPIVAAAHAVGARVFVDAVHLVPHRRVDVAAMGVDALVTSPYKWYGPHAGAMWVEPELMAGLPVAKVRPAADDGPRRWETGTPAFEALAAVEAAARFLLDESMEAVADAEAAVFAPLLEGLLDTAGVRVWGPPTMTGRVPTVAFTVDGHHPDAVARALAAEKIAVWSGDSYAVEVAGQLGVAESGGVVRAGVVRYVSDEDVQRLLAAVRALTTSG